MSESAALPANPGKMNRREFLRRAGLGLAAVGLAVPDFARAKTVGAAGALSHFVPAEKNLKPEWIHNLFARGTKEIFRGPDLRYIGMPVGGIGTGQLYLCGDGRLANWEIFNRYEYLGTGELNYAPRIPAKPVDQGFAIILERGGHLEARGLNAGEFSVVEFSGEYPIGRVTFKDPAFPLEVELEAFSPFIPLNAKDSALPATVFSIQIRNMLDQPASVRALGWLENALCIHSSEDVSGSRVTRWISRRGRTLMAHHATSLECAARRSATPLSGANAGDLKQSNRFEGTSQRASALSRPPIVLQDFEGFDYGAWKTTGEAFGAKPANGKMEPWQDVKGFLGKGLANSYLRADSSTGKLVSPEFSIERHFINFLVAGGHFPGSPAGVELVTLKIDGSVVRSTTGDNTDQLRWESWDVSACEGKRAIIEILDTRPYPGGHILVDQIEMSDEKRRRPTEPFDRMPDFGTLSLSLRGKSDQSAVAEVVKLLTAPANRNFQHTSSPQPFPNRPNAALASASVRLRPGQSRTFTFVLSWHFPNTKNGHEYAARFADATAVANYVLDHFDRLAGDTRCWRDTYYDSTLPFWLLDRLHSTVSTLATGTCQWWASGRFWAWEGVVSCPGTCTHVWNYAHADARLFPELARSVREMQDFNSGTGGFHPDTGLVGFRGNDQYAADGQCGTVLKAYREHILSPDSEFLKRNWPRIRQTLEFCIQQDREGSSDEDGLIENSQPNTYDIAFHGANTYVGALYLAALRAGEEMARELGDMVFADRARKIFERGRQHTVDRLWKGEYFIQDVDLSKHPSNQYGRGCLADQLFGQSWAHQLGLGYLYPPGNVKEALQSIWKYNWAPDVAPQLVAHPALRTFASPGEAALFLLTWPHSPYLDASIPYKGEVWTGIEYQVAAHMIWEGQAEQGLAICRAVHDRYHPSRRNPYNEVECGDHYARALASWGVFVALSGFEYHGPKGHIAFAPRITPENFKAAFTTAEGWGTFAQRLEGAVQRETLILRWGRLRLRTLAFQSIRALAPVRFALDVDRQKIPASLDLDHDRLLITLPSAISLTPGQNLNLTFS